VKDSHGISRGVLFVRAIPGGSMQKKHSTSTDYQLSLFEGPLLVQQFKEPSVLEFVRARFEYGPEMSKEEYKHFIKVLVNASIKRME